MQNMSSIRQNISWLNLQYVRKGHVFRLMHDFFYFDIRLDFFKIETYNCNRRKDRWISDFQKEHLE